MLQRRLIRQPTKRSTKRTKRLGDRPIQIITSYTEGRTTFRGSTVWTWTSSRRCFGPATIDAYAARLHFPRFSTSNPALIIATVREWFAESFATDATDLWAMPRITRRSFRNALVTSNGESFNQTPCFGLRHHHDQVNVLAESGDHFFIKRTSFSPIGSYITLCISYVKSGYNARAGMWNGIWRELKGYRSSVCRSGLSRSLSLQAASPPRLTNRLGSRGRSAPAHRPASASPRFARQLWKLLPTPTPS